MKKKECTHPDFIMCMECAPYNMIIDPTKPLHDDVNHPDHYAKYPIECITVIEMIPHLRDNYHLGNAFKYLWRAGEKDPSKLHEDIRKAIWYLNRFVEEKE